jgi:hypothetical protein
MATLGPIFGKHNFRKFREIPLEKMCKDCGTGLQLYARPCGHAYCINCAQAENVQRCQQCTSSHCSTF